MPAVGRLAGELAVGSAGRRRGGRARVDVADRRTRLTEVSSSERQ